MAPRVSVVNDDVTRIEADVLLLKFAQHFYGADEAVALRLIQNGVCRENDISPGPGEARLLETRGAIAARQVLFLGTPRLANFRYSQMQQFARRAIETLARQKTSPRTLATTILGAGYGLYMAEALR